MIDTAMFWVETPGNGVVAICYESDEYDWPSASYWIVPGTLT